MGDYYIHVIVLINVEYSFLSQGLLVKMLSQSQTATLGIGCSKAWAGHLAQALGQMAKG